MVPAGIDYPHGVVVAVGNVEVSEGIEGDLLRCVEHGAGGGAVVATIAACAVGSAGEDVDVPIGVDLPDGIQVVVAEVEIADGSRTIPYPPSRVAEVARPPSPDSPGPVRQATIHCLPECSIARGRTATGFLTGAEEGDGLRRVGSAVCHRESCSECARGGRIEVDSDGAGSRRAAWLKKSPRSFRMCRSDRR